MSSSYLSIVMVGEVDHGKSSVVGRILDETGAISPSRIETVRRICKEQGKEFEHAFLLDAFEEEQRQGITIDVSHIQFQTPRRFYRLIDAPGHREFLKNMVSGSSAADAAILLVDAKEGVQEQSRRHSYLLKLLGIDQVIVAVNKMDLEGWKEKPYEVIVKNHGKYLAEIGIKALHYVPMSARFGVNITRKGNEAPWYQGPTLLEALDQLPARKANTEAPLRFPIQDVYKFDERRIIAGRIESGTLRAGDELRVWPAGRKVKVASVERWSAPASPDAIAGESIGITLTEQAFVERGNVLTHEAQPASVSTLVDASVFWMGKRPLALNLPVKIKLLTQEIDCQVERIHRIIDTTTLKGEASTAHEIQRHEVGEVTLRLSRPLALDAFTTVQESGRFVLVDSGQVSGGGIISRPLSAYAQIAQPSSKNIAWEFSKVTAAERFARNGHRGAVLWMTGLSGSGKSTVSKALEKELFRRGCQTFVLDGDNIRHGLNADLDFSAASRSENIRRVGEVAKLFAEAGQIVITAFISPFEADRERVRKILDPGMFFEVYMKCPIEVCEKRDPKGLYKKARAGLLPDFTGISSPFEEPKKPEILVESGKSSPDDAVQAILKHLEAQGVFKT